MLKSFLRRARHQSPARTRGQSLAEFALILVPLMLILAGTIQFGVIWATQVGVTNAVRDTARAASMAQPKASTAGNVTPDAEIAVAKNIDQKVLLKSLSSNVPFYGVGNVTTHRVCYSTFLDLNNDLKLQATVTVAYGHPILIPLLSGILGNSLTTTTSLTIPVGLDQPYQLPPVPSPNGSDSQCVAP
jgi:Flp pilus assembly protein TadG